MPAQCGEPCCPADPVGVEEEGADAEDEVYQEELLQLLQRESEGKDVFQNYRSTFKDQYGDQHDWQSDTTVQHYLCWELYLHYTQQVCFRRALQDLGMCEHNVYLCVCACVCVCRRWRGCCRSGWSF